MKKLVFVFAFITTILVNVQFSRASTDYKLIKSSQFVNGHESTLSVELTINISTAQSIGENANKAKECTITGNLTLTTEDNCSVTIKVEITAETCGEAVKALNTLAKALAEEME